MKILLKVSFWTKNLEKLASSIPGFGIGILVVVKIHNQPAICILHECYKEEEKKLIYFKWCWFLLMILPIAWTYPSCNSLCKDAHPAADIIYLNMWKITRNIIVSHVLKQQCVPLHCVQFYLVRLIIRGFCYILRSTAGLEKRPVSLQLQREARASGQAS